MLIHIAEQTSGGETRSYLFLYRPGLCSEGAGGAGTALTRAGVESGCARGSGGPTG